MSMTLAPIQRNRRHDGNVLRKPIRGLIGIAAALAVSAAGPTQAQQPPAAGEHPPFPQFAWQPSLPLRFGDPAITPIGGTEVRALVVFDHKLFAGVGYWQDRERKNPALPGAQVLRLDAADAPWQVDLELTERDPWQVKLRKYLAISVIAPVRFTVDDERRPLDPPADLLLAGVWSRNIGVDVFSRTTGAASWSAIPIPGQEAARVESHVRSFVVHRDRKTGAEMVFAGSTNAIFVGRYNRQKRNVVWNEKPDWTGELRAINDKSRVMSLAECDGKIYATQNDTIYERTDGEAPVWSKIFQTSIRSFEPNLSGLRGMTCISNPSGQGQSLLVSVEDEPARIYRIDLAASDAGGPKSTLELNVASFLSEALGTKATFAIAAHNDMTKYAVPGGGCPRLLMGVEARTPDAPETLGTLKYRPFANFLVRACDASYSLQEIFDPRIVPKPWLGAVRSLAPSPFAADPAGTLYAGGFDTHFSPAHNTAWLYKGVPVTSP